MTNIDDEYEHPSDNEVEYVLENVLFEEDNDKEECEEIACLRELYNSILLSACQCAPTSNCNNCFRGGNYKTSKNSSNEELVLCENQKSELIYECSSLCECHPSNCQNRLVQLGPRRHLKIINSSKYKSKGLITTKHIPRGAFICEYAGELLTLSEARRRTKENDLHNRMNYILCLNEFGVEATAENGQHQMTIIDPSRRGNIGRYLNHSCTPNCDLLSVRIDCPIPKVAIFANRDINAGEELTFHYNNGMKSQHNTNTINSLKTECLCASENCQKYLPNIEFQ